MIQGFYTKPSMDKATAELFRSIPDGRIHGRPTHVESPWSQTHWRSFKSVKDGPCVCFGVLRGTGNIIKQCQNNNIDFYYGDHSYIFNDDTMTKEKSYRITKNDFQVRDIQELTKEEINRVEKIKNGNITPQPCKKNHHGYILICPPSHYSVKYFLNGKDWLKETEDIIRQNTDIPIKIRKKDDKHPLEKDIKNASIIVSYNSTVAIHALLAGVPSFCDKISAASNMSNLDYTDIENPFYPDNREEWLNTLLANQFTLEEMRNGYAWSKVNGNI